MKLYTTEKGHWAGTQADARKLAKQHSISCDVFEVPVDKKGLLDFLNTNRVTVGSESTTLTGDHEVVEHVPTTNHEEVKIVGQTREEYMRRWKQEQADWSSEYKCNEAIETVLWDAPHQYLGSYISIIIDRMANLKGGEE
jgi:hypothetical protein